MLRLSSDPSLRLQAMINLGALYHAIGRDDAAEKQWEAAAALDPKESGIWFSLADLYEQDGHPLRSIQAFEHGIPLCNDPTIKARAQMKLARLYMMNHEPKKVLESLDDAENTAPSELLAEKSGRSFSFDIAQGRAAAWSVLGDAAKATGFEEEAVRLDPDAPDAWSHLAKLYAKDGRTAEQLRAEQRSKALSSAAPPKR